MDTNTDGWDVISIDSVNDCFNVLPNTNIVLLSFMLHAGYKTISSFALDIGVDRSRLSQIIHNKIPADDKMKILIAKKLNTDSRILFAEK